jgi:DNA invertase Pin-like site-specific DNA recombinase
MPAPRRVLGYARVSSEEQAKGTSLADQQDAIRAYARTQGLSVARFYVEAESSLREKAEKREQIQALMADAKTGDLILCDKIDRWSRDPEYTYQSIRQILERGARFFAVGDNCDPSTSEGDTMLNFRVLFAREEHKRIKQRMVGTRRLLRDRGYYADGLAPFGYRRSLAKGHKGLSKNILVIQEDEAKVVRRIFSLCIAGRSVTQIGVTVGRSRDQIFSILRGRIFIGEIENTAGEWIAGKHAPIIDADTFTRATEARSARQLGGARQRDAESETSSWILRDVAICGRCGSKMSSAYAGPHEARRYYYRCFKKCTTRYVNVSAIEAAAEPLIVQRLLDLREELAKEPKTSAPSKAAREDIGDRRAKLQKKRDRFVEMYADGTISKDELSNHLGSVDVQLMKLVASGQALVRPNPLADPLLRRSVLKMVSNIHRAWSRAAPKIKRQIVEQLASAVRLDADKKPVALWRSPEDLAVSVA